MEDERADGGGSLLDRAKEALTHGEEDGPVGGSAPEAETGVAPIDTPDNRGNFGSMDDILRDNAATRRAAEGLDDEELAEGPANTDPDVAQGSI